MPFYIENVVGSLIGLVIIYWSKPIADWLGEYVTAGWVGGQVRDLNSSFVIKIVGIVLIAINVVLLFLSLS